MLHGHLSLVGCFAPALLLLGHIKDLAQWPLVLQALQIESFAGHNSFRKTWNLIQNLHFLGLSSGMSQGGALMLSEFLFDLFFFVGRCSSFVYLRRKLICLK